MVQSSLARHTVCKTCKDMHGLQTVWLVRLGSNLMYTNLNLTSKLSMNQAIYVHSLLTETVAYSAIPCTKFLFCVFCSIKLIQCTYMYVGSNSNCCMLCHSLHAPLPLSLSTVKRGKSHTQRKLSCSPSDLSALVSGLSVPYWTTTTTGTYVYYNIVHRTTLLSTAHVQPSPYL